MGIGIFRFYSTWNGVYHGTLPMIWLFLKFMAEVGVKSVKRTNIREKVSELSAELINTPVNHFYITTTELINFSLNVGDQVCEMFFKLRDRIS